MQPKYLLDNQESQRLYFRRVTLDDFDEWKVFFQDAESTQFLGLPEMEPDELCRYWINLSLERSKNGKGGMNALIEKSTGAYIGHCGLLVQEIDGIEELEVGYSIIREYWGRGFATEAAIKCKEFAFQNDFALSLISIIDHENHASKRVAMKNGMKYEKDSVFHDHPVEIYRIHQTK